MLGDRGGLGRCRESIGADHFYLSAANRDYGCNRGEMSKPVRGRYYISSSEIRCLLLWARITSIQRPLAQRCLPCMLDVLRRTHVGFIGSSASFLVVLEKLCKCLVNTRPLEGCSLPACGIGVWAGLGVSMRLVQGGAGRGRIDHPLFPVLAITAVAIEYDEFGRGLLFLLFPLAT